MRAPTSIALGSALTLALALLSVGCETTPKASSPASCNCAEKHSGRQPPPKEEPADLIR